MVIISNPGVPVQRAEQAPSVIEQSVPGKLADNAPQLPADGDSVRDGNPAEQAATRRAADNAVAGWATQGVTTAGVSVGNGTAVAQTGGNLAADNIYLADAVQLTPNELRHNLQATLKALATTSRAQLSAILQQAYGDKLDGLALDRLISQATAGALPMPRNVQVVDAATLNGANAAYSPAAGGTIYLNASLSPKAMQAAFNEEAGHHLDVLLGGADSRGDEGEILQRGLALGRPLDAESLAQARADRDQATIQIDGVAVAVELQSGNEISSILRDLKADLNRSLWDLSPGMVTHAELLSAHARLAALPDDRFDLALNNLARDSNAGSRADDFLGNYIEALAAEEPAKLTELVARFATAVNPTDTGPALVRQIRGDAWEYLTAALERMPLENADGTGRMDVIHSLGGGRTIGQKLAYEYSLALLDGDTDDALRIAGFAARAERMAPGSMPRFVGRIAATDRAGIERLEELLRDVENPRDALRRGRPELVRGFERFAVRELGMTTAQAQLLAAALRVTTRKALFSLPDPVWTTRLG